MKSLCVRMDPNVSVHAAGWLWHQSKPTWAICRPDSHHRLHRRHLLYQQADQQQLRLRGCGYSRRHCGLCVKGASSSISWCVGHRLRHRGQAGRGPPAVDDPVKPA